MPRHRSDSAQRADSTVEGRAVTAAPAEGLAELADDLLREVIELRRRYEELDHVLQSIERSPSQEAPARHPRRESTDAGRATDRAASPQLGAARNIARTAVHSGASRQRVEAYLRDELGLEDSDAVLEELFGAERTPSKRSRRWRRHKK
jgi:hypothetical protein